MPLASATRAKVYPYLPSLSRMRERGRWSNGVASRNCWATRASVGWRVAPTWTTRRAVSAMMKQVHSGRKRRSVTGRKSQAQMSGAWFFRKVAYACPRGRGVWGPRKYVWMVRLATRRPSLPKFTADAFRAPAWVLGRQPPDQGEGLGGERRAPRPRARRAPPERAEPRAMPTQGPRTSLTTAQPKEQLALPHR